jgi:hypothetical protein
VSFDNAGAISRVVAESAGRWLAHRVSSGLAAMARGNLETLVPPCSRGACRVRLQFRFQLNLPIFSSFVYRRGPVDELDEVTLKFFVFNEQSLVAMQACCARWTRRHSAVGNLLSAARALRRQGCSPSRLPGPPYRQWRHQARPGPGSVQLLNFSAHPGWMTHMQTHMRNSTV